MKKLKEITNSELLNELVYQVDMSSNPYESSYISLIKEEILYRMNTGKIL